MSLVADYATLPVVLAYEDLPAAAPSTGFRVLVASLSQVARWSGSAWVLSPVDELTLSDITNVSQMPLQANSAATMVSEVVTDFNDLLAKLQTAGLMASS